MNHNSQSKQWFGEQVETHMDALFATAMRLSDSRPDAEDIVAEAVAKAWIALSSLKDEQSFKPWIFRILYNVFYSECRKTGRQPAAFVYDEQPLEDENNQVASFLVHQPDEFLLTRQ